MKKLLVMLVLMTAVGLASITYPTQAIFYDGFEAGNLNNWVVSGEWVASTSSPGNGSYSAYFNNNATEHTMNRSQSTLNYTSVNVSFWAATGTGGNTNDAGENLTLKWYNGTGWTKVWSVEDVTAGYYNVPLSDAANNANFRISFSCINNAAGEFCKVDDVGIIGTNTSTGAINIIYQTPLNGSSTVLDQNALFNVTVNFTCVSGTCGDVNATLKYNATASYPNRDVSNVTGATPFFIRSTVKESRPLAYSSINFANPEYAIDLRFNDTTTWAYYFAAVEGRINYTFSVGTDPAPIVVYTIAGDSIYGASIRAWNWTEGNWDEIRYVSNLPSFTTYADAIDPTFIASNRTVRIQFFKGAVATASPFNVSDVYVIPSNLNPATCPVMAKGDNCTVTWQVNATRASGNYWLNVTFNQETGAQNSTSPNFQINTTGAAADTTAPNIASWAFNVSNMTNYSSTQGYNFNATVTDTTGISYVWLEQNFTGTLTNTTASSCGGNVYCYNVSKLAAGVYYVKWYANDSSSNHNLNNSDWVHYYQVNKSYLPISLYINGTNGDKTLYNNSNANFTANFTTGYGFNITLYTNLTGSMILWDNRASPFSNYTVLSPYQARVYLIKANWSGNGNYTYSQANHSLTLEVLYGWLNISYQSPATGNSQNVNQNGTFNVTVNVTCVSGTCGNVTGVLRYNGSSGLNPDTNISLTTGATPLYIPNVKMTNVYNAAYWINSVAIGDADNDGVTEFVSGGAPYCTKACQSELSIYNKVSGEWIEDWIDSLSLTFNSVAVGDADNNGKKEVVVGASSGSDQVRMYVNESGQWIQYNITSMETSAVYSVAVGDADNDGKNEVVAGAAGAANNETKMYENISSGVWAGYNISEVGDTVYSVAIGDANNDGQNEVVIGAGGTITNEVRMYNYSGGAWVETNISDVSGTVYSVAIGDANNDGQNEIVIGTAAGTNKVRMYENKTGTWVETNISDEPVTVYSVAIGDADNDGQNEVVVGMSNTTNEVRMYENKTGTWVETNISNLGTIYGLAIGDINGYGLNSVVAGGYGPSALVKVFDVQSNPISCGAMSAGEKCYVTWTVNATGPQETQYWLDVNFTSDSASVPANDSGNFQVNIISPAIVGVLNVTLIKPEGNISVLKNRIFTTGVRIVCLGEAGANCYQAWAYPEYNSTGQTPWYPVSTIEGATPFFIAGTYSETSRDTANTILRMHMDNTGSDSATSVYDETNKNNGTKLGDGSPAWSDGRFDSGLNFDGSDDYFNVSTISALNTYGKNLTIEFWFRSNKNTFPNGSTILARNWDDTGNNSFWIFFWNNPGPKLHFYTKTGGTANDLEGIYSDWVPGRWYHIAATFNGSRAELYINGSLDNAYNYAGGNIDKSDNILIVGAKNLSAGAGSFNGSIDELAIYNRTKNATEIEQDYKTDAAFCSLMTKDQSCKIVWAVNATGAVLTDWIFNIYTYSSNYSISDNYTPNFTVSIAPIAGCGQYISCAYPNCAFYRDTTTTIQSTDSRQKVWSTIRTCWS